MLVDHVLPAVGYRQWVFSFPGPMAVRLGYDAPLLAAVAGRLARAVMQDMRRGVKQQHCLASVAICGEGGRVEGRPHSLQDHIPRPASRHP